MSDLTVWAQNHYHLFKDFAGPVATGVAAITAIVVTYRFNKQQIEISRTQRDIAIDKLKFDLFELRYGIYLAAKELIEYVSNKGDLAEFNSDKMRSLYVKLDEARFFFDNVAVSFMQEIERTIERRLELMAERERANIDDAALWGKLADE